MEKVEESNLPLPKAQASDELTDEEAELSDEALKAVAGGFIDFPDEIIVEPGGEISVD